MLTGLFLNFFTFIYTLGQGEIALNLNPYAYIFKINPLCSKLRSAVLQSVCRLCSINWNTWIRLVFREKGDCRITKKSKT
jgi:hypothetical protein